MDSFDACREIPGSAAVAAMPGRWARVPRLIRPTVGACTLVAAFWLAAGAGQPTLASSASRESAAGGAAEAAVGSGAPTRIVSMVPSITETLFALGIGKRVVGVSDQCDYPPETAALPRVGSFLTPAAEAIVALEPDLVLTSPSPGNESAVRAIERAGVRVEVVYGDSSLAEVRAAIGRTAELAGRVEAGRVLLAALDADIAGVRESARGKPPVKVAVVVGRDPLVLAGPASYLGEMVEIAGGDNIALATGGRWPRIGLEFLVEAAPEVIIDISMGAEHEPDAAELAARWARLKAVPAIASGRLFGHHSSLLLRPGPRLGQAAGVVAAMLHGEGSH